MNILKRIWIRIWYLWFKIFHREDCMIINAILDALEKEKKHG